MASIPAYKARCYDLTVHEGHLNDLDLGSEERKLGLGTVFLLLSSLVDDGLVEYAAVAYETPRGGRAHIQGFITFAPLAYQDEGHYRETRDGKGKVRKTTRFTPSRVFRDVGSFRQVRSISGARDYCVRAGIHAGKAGLHFAAEYGDFVDPSWNLSMRSRTICMMSSLLGRGVHSSTISSEFPLEVALLGGHTWSDLKRLSVSKASRQDCVLRPYYYIGLENLRDSVLPAVGFEPLADCPGE